jgi:hypothetical protein
LQRKWHNIKMKAWGWGCGSVVQCLLNVWDLEFSHWHSKMKTMTTMMKALHKTFYNRKVITIIYKWILHFPICFFLLFSFALLFWHWGLNSRPCTCSQILYYLSHVISP